MVKPIKALLLTTPFSKFYQGGAEVQAHNTACALKKKIDVHLSLSELSSLNELSIVHFFRIHPSFFEFAELLTSRNIPYVVSPIYFPPDWRRRGLMQFLASQKLRLPVSLSSFGEKLRFLRNAKAIFPNTSAEEEFIKKISPKSEIVRVNNCVDDEYYSLLDRFTQIECSSSRAIGTVLCVGRIESRKGQLQLLEACVELNLSLTTIGEIRDTQIFSAMRNKNYDKWTHLPFSANREFLLGQYLHHEIYAQPSQMETPGLASMEASLAGCKLVTCSAGGTSDYFQRRAQFLETQRKEEIIGALRKASNSTLSKEPIKFSRYDEIADVYIKCYHQVVNRYC